MSHARVLVALVMTALGFLPVGCDGCSSTSAKTRDDKCPAVSAAPQLLPEVRSEHRTAAYWLRRLDERYGGAHQVVMSVAQIEAYNHNRHEHDLRAPPRWEWIRSEVRNQLKAMEQQVTSEALVLANGRPLAREQREALRDPQLEPEVRLVRADENTPMYCAPFADALLKREDLDRRFDRNLCNTVRRGEAVRLLARVGRFWLAETDYTWGFVRDAEFEPLERAVLHPPEGGLTRARLFEEAFSHLGEPYGWGGFEGGRDCSRFVLDSFRAQGLRVPRNSGAQSRAGVRTVTELPAEREARLALIDNAARTGAVLLHLPGHIMLYLGMSKEGIPMVIHAFASYERACAGAEGATRFEVHRTEVSSLHLGNTSEQGSLLERIDRFTVFEKAPP